jgi:hypothetical protein
MQDAKAIKTTHYLNPKEIEQLLEKVEYIIMAAPSPEHFSTAPIHFTFFLNTHEELPNGVKEAVLDKFLEENNIKNPIHVMSQLAPVGFATTQQETPMPMLLVQPQDIHSIPHTFLHVIDFLADSDGFEEVKKNSLTGWSYVYES